MGLLMGFLGIYGESFNAIMSIFICSHNPVSYDI